MRGVPTHLIVTSFLGEQSTMKQPNTRHNHSVESLPYFRGGDYPVDWVDIDL